MENARSSDYGEWTPQLNQFVFVFIDSCTIRICLHVSQVSYVSDLISWAAMRLAERIVMLSSSQASVRQVTKLVNVEPVLVIRFETAEVSSNFGGSELAFLLKLDNSFASLVWL